MSSSLDHLTVTAATLEAGLRWLERKLGLPMQAGGEHPLMGTHNALFRLGDATFIEVISINPQAPAPKRPRWFGLDMLAADASPSLATWVAACTDIDSLCQASTAGLGTVLQLNRGAYNWQMSVPDDGRLILGGCAPALIQWQGDEHPASSLTDRGCSFVGLTLRHENPQLIEALLDSIQCTSPINVLRRKNPLEPALQAMIQTPKGLIML